MAVIDCVSDWVDLFQCWPRAIFDIWILNSKLIRTKVGTIEFVRPKLNQN